MVIDDSMKKLLEGIDPEDIIDLQALNHRNDNVLLKDKNSLDCFGTLKVYPLVRSCKNKRKGQRKREEIKTSEIVKPLNDSNSKENKLNTQFCRISSTEEDLDDLYPSFPESSNNEDFETISLTDVIFFTSSDVTENRDSQGQDLPCGIFNFNIGHQPINSRQLPRPNYQSFIDRISSIIKFW